MDCKTATLVYQSENHLEKIQEIFPGAWKFLEEVSFAYVQKKPDKFDAAVKEIVGETPFQFRMVHRDDRDQLTKDLSDLLGDITSRLLLEKHFSEVVGQPVFFSTICCNSHLTSDHELTLEEVLPLQRAAVKLQ
ncbi:hypothetical protein [Fischerella thermalis]|uniref:hypothetical protein n=1 Tax=Fischerella thermalis TaxID=372787 RepID=UPI000C805520|nr:hypothetical protein [Fischerella thermalis]PLZ15813.1 hypothetical protein CBP19_06050 [Fischerella thermalis WC1110]PLZ29875.1 hypothetical protein CBP10_14225 [Fischerella thermalis WC558]PLZ39234.1 hypothetical protein CBP26_12810 [Fischerella thermalis WC538]PLZ43810.1 hypothetical protein CBP25_12145 [Fischerella thermalis WC527]PLZ50533.1 hypothetical protein CBP13_14810 [Fischerella thermalis WC441]